MVAKFTRAAAAVMCVVCMAALCACGSRSGDVPEPSVQSSSVTSSTALVLRVFTVSSMARTAVRVDERAATAKTRTMARRGHHYFDVVLSVPVSLLDGPPASRIGRPYLVMGGAKLPMLDSASSQRPSGASRVLFIAEFEVPLGARPQSVHVPVGIQGAEVAIPLR